jgi:hypothetical protein
MALMRVIVWLGVPVGVLAFLASITMLLGWTNGDDLCRTWLSVDLTYCR